jgi:hypothetical protein
MPALNIEDALRKMAEAASAVLKGKWPVVRSYAETEFKKLAETLALIIREKETGAITEEEAAILLDMQKQATRAVLTAVEGLGVLAAEEAINAALGAVKDIVNRAIGWTLL